MVSLSIIGLDTYSIEQVVMSHQIYMFGIWSVLVELPRLLMRYGKVTINNYLNLHSISMMIFSLVTAYYTVVMLVLFSDQAAIDERNSDPVLLGHFICAIILLAVIILQVVTGITIRTLLLRQKYQILLRISKILHAACGYLTIVCGRITITLGLFKLGNQNLWKPWLFILGSLYIILLIIEGLYKMELSVFLKGIDKKQISQKTPEGHYYFNIAKMIEDGATPLEIIKEYPDARYVLIDNALYCLDDLDHPGGEFIIEQVIGKEVNYLLHGSHHTLSSPIRHQHSKYIWRYLSQRYVAPIKFEKTIIVDGEEARPDWLVQDVTQVSKDLSIFKFVSKNAQLKNSMDSVSSMGKFFIIESVGEGIEPIRRPYSMIMCMTDENIRHRAAVKQLYRNRESTEYLEKLSSQPMSNVLPLAIKNYDGGQFTSYLNRFSNKHFKIHGPYVKLFDIQGRGLNLHENCSGVYTIIAGGTGILPFLDLFDFLLRKSIYRVLQSKFGRAETDKMNPHDYNYQILEQLQVKLYASFNNKDEFYGSSLITDLYFLNEVHDLGTQLHYADYFDFQLRLSSGEDEEGIKMMRHNFDAVFLKEVVDRRPDRVYVCGPEQMVETVKGHLDNLGFSPGKIFFL